jgi:hypothetical protein
MIMETEYMLEMLETIEHQESSSILGGMEHEYEELEALGYVTIHREHVQHYAVLTPMGKLKIQQLRDGQ